MKKLSVFLVVFLVASSFVKAGNHREFQTGKLLDVTSDERLFEGTTIRHAIYHVQIGDVVYLGQGEKIRRHSADPAHGLIVGDTVQVAIDKDDLILQCPNGKEIKARIVKRMRADTAK